MEKASQNAKVSGVSQRVVFKRVVPKTLRALTSLIITEVRPFFLRDNGIWSFPSVSSLSDYSIWRSCCSSLAIIAFGASELIVPKYQYRLGKMDKRRLDSLSKQVTVFKEGSFWQMFPCVEISSKKSFPAALPWPKKAVIFAGEP